MTNRSRMSPMAKTSTTLSTFAAIFDRANAARAQGEGNILTDGQVRVERNELKHHSDVALGRRQFGDNFAVETDFPRRALLEAGDASQRGRLAAAGRPEQDDEFSIVQGQRETIDGRDAAEADREIVDVDPGH